MENKYGKTSKLMIKASVKKDRTILSDASFTAPFKIMHPFYPYDDHLFDIAPHTNGEESVPNIKLFDCHQYLSGCMTVMCLTASAGIMAGDKQHHEIIVEEGAKLEFVSQAYEKIHKMETGSAERNCLIHIAKDAFLYYNPLPTIPFKDSAFTSRIEAHLEETSSKFIYKEILSAGRCARDEKFAYHFYHNHIQVYLKDQLVYVDNTRLEPSQMPPDALGLFENYTHLGTLLLFNVPASEAWLQKVRELLNDAEGIEGGITITQTQGIVIRMLGLGSEKISHIMDKILAL